MEPNLYVLIIQNQARDLISDLCTLLVRHIIDRETVSSPAKYTFPARQWMRSYQRVMTLEFEPNVAAGATWAGEHLLGIGLSVAMESLGVVSGRQGLKKPFVRSG